MWVVLLWVLVRFVGFCVGCVVVVACFWFGCVLSIRVGLVSLLCLFVCRFGCLVLVCGLLFVVLGFGFGFTFCFGGCVMCFGFGCDWVGCFVLCVLDFELLDGFYGLVSWWVCFELFDWIGFVILFLCLDSWFLLFCFVVVMILFYYFCLGFVC